MTVSEIRPILEERDGETIIARGWIEGCNHTFNCVLADRPSGSGNREELILDYVQELEDELGAASGHQVLLQAEITDECVVNICTDRAAVLIPQRLLRVY